MIKYNMNSEGFTLIELLVALAMASIVMVAIVSAYQIQVKGKNVQEITIDMNQTARAAMEMLESDIRMAGCDPRGSADAGITIAEVAELEFTMDINNDSNQRISDGDAGDFGEVIRFALDNDSDGDGFADGTPCNLARDRGSGLEPLALNIDWLNFVYLGPDNDGDGNPDILAAPVTGNDLDDIRMIQVTFVARSGAVLRGMTGSYTDTNTYSNESQWLDSSDASYEDFDPDSDLGGDAEKFRRLQLTKTIYCRNMGF